MLREALQKLVDGSDLTEGEMVDAMEAIMGGEATHAQMAAFLTALRIKGETVEEITGAARVMREHATPIWIGGRPAPAVSIDRDEINEVAFFGIGLPRQMAPPRSSPFYSEAYEKAYTEYDPASNRRD